MEKTPIVFAKGVNFYKPRENAPEWVKGSIVINIEQLLAFAEEQDIKNTLRFDLRKSKDKGTLYLTLNTFNPVKKPLEFDNTKPVINEETGGEILF
jgi:hypothetical protein